MIHLDYKSNIRSVDSERNEKKKLIQKERPLTEVKGLKGDVVKSYPPHILQQNYNTLTIIKLLNISNVYAVQNCGILNSL